MKKFISLTLVIVLIGAMLIGCSNNQTGDESGSNAETTNSTNQNENGQLPSNFNPTGFPIVNEKITLKMMGPKAPIQGPWDQLLFFQEMEKLTNIHFEFDTPPVDNYIEKKNLAFASGEVPDVFFGGNLTPSDETIYGSQGTLIPLEGLVDKYAPNLKKLMEQDANIKKSITALDGHIYALPQVNTVIRDLIPTKIWFNSKWLSNVGMEAPKTVDQFYDVLKAFKGKDPNGNGKADEIPMSFYKSTAGIQSMRLGMLAAFGFVDDVITVKNDRIIYVPAQAEYKEYLAFMAKLYAEGLLDPESFSQTDQQLTAKGNEGRVGVFAHAGPYLVATMEDSFNYIALPPLSSSVNNKQMWPKKPSITRGTFAITNTSKYPEASMRWVDYLYSPEGGAFLSQGPEGVGWKWKDEQHTKWEKILPEGYTNTEEYRGGKVTPSCGTTTPGMVSADFILKLDAAHVSYANDQAVNSYQPYFQDQYPLVYFTSDEQKQLTALETDLNTYVSQMEAKFITGAESLSNWDSYLSTLEKMRIDEVVKIYQDAYDRWKNVK